MRSWLPLPVDLARERAREGLERRRQHLPGRLQTDASCLAGIRAVRAQPLLHVPVMRAKDPVGLLEAIEQRTEESPALYDAISRRSRILMR